MNFWRYCEKVSLGLGLKKALDNIHMIHSYWEENITVGDCIKDIQQRKETIGPSNTELAT